MNNLMTWVRIAFLMLTSISLNAFSVERIITIDGSLTEIVYALDGGSELVGRDVTSRYPEAANKLPSIGYMRSLTVEGILSLNPTLILMTKDAQPQSVLDQLQKTGIKTEVIDNEYSVQGIINKINTVANLLNKQEAGDELIAVFQSNIANAKIQIAKILKGKQAPKGLFVMQARGDNLLVSGNHTRASALMDLIGMENPAKLKFSQYKPLSPESVLTFNPEWIIMMPHSVRAAGGKNELLSMPAIAKTTAGKQKKILIIDGDYLSFGPRLGEHLIEFSKKLSR